VSEQEKQAPDTFDGTMNSTDVDVTTLEIKPDPNLPASDRLASWIMADPSRAMAMNLRRWS
jgi:hypothetical protein